jgi:hypothetical protein
MYPARWLFVRWGFGWFVRYGSDRTLQDGQFHSPIGLSLHNPYVPCGRTKVNRFFREEFFYRVTFCRC